MHISGMCTNSLKKKKRKKFQTWIHTNLEVVCRPIGQKMAKFDSWNSSYKRGALFKILGKKWPSWTAGTLHKQSKSYIKIVCTSLICVRMIYERRNSKLEYCRRSSPDKRTTLLAAARHSHLFNDQIFIYENKNTGHFWLTIVLWHIVKFEFTGCKYENIVKVVHTPIQ